MCKYVYPGQGGSRSLSIVLQAAVPSQRFGLLQNVTITGEALALPSEH